MVTTRLTLPVMCHGFRTHSRNANIRRNFMLDATIRHKECFYNEDVNGFRAIRMVSRKQPRSVAVNSLPPLLGRGRDDVWMAMCIATALTQYLERRTRFGSYLSGPFIAICIGLLGAGVFSVLPVVSPVYDIVSTRFLPIGVAMYVLEVDISHVFSTKSSTMLIAFLIGAMATCVGTICSFMLFASRMGVDAVNICSALCASYIGGSVNFAAVISALGTKIPDTVTTAMSADNLMMGMYLACLMQISLSGSQQSAGGNDPSNVMGREENLPVSPESISYGLAIAFISTSIARSLAARIGYPSLGLALVSIVACLIAPSMSRLMRTNTQRLFSGSTSIASICMTLFFCAMGAQAGGVPLFSGSAGVALFGFIFVQLSVQLSLSLLAGRMIGIPLDVMLIACNANVGGAATAVAMCISKRWNHLLQPALLVASLGYIIGNPIGLAMAKVLTQI